MFFAVKKTAFMQSLWQAGKETLRGHQAVRETYRHWAFLIDLYEGFICCFLSDLTLLKLQKMSLVGSVVMIWGIELKIFGGFLRSH